MKRFFGRGLAAVVACLVVLGATVAQAELVVPDMFGTDTVQSIVDDVGTEMAPSLMAIFGLAIGVALAFWAIYQIKRVLGRRGG